MNNDSLYSLGEFLFTENPDVEKVSYPFCEENPDYFILRLKNGDEFQVKLIKI